MRANKNAPRTQGLTKQKPIANRKQTRNRTLSPNLNAASMVSPMQILKSSLFALKCLGVPAYFHTCWVLQCWRTYFSYLAGRRTFLGGRDERLQTSNTFNVNAVHRRPTTPGQQKSGPWAVRNVLCPNKIQDKHHIDMARNPQLKCCSAKKTIILPLETSSFTYKLRQRFWLIAST